MSPTAPEDGEAVLLPDHISSPRTCQLPGGLIGYYQQAWNECRRACVATILQRPYDEVPSMPQHHQLEAFAEEEGLEIKSHHPNSGIPELGPPVGLWIMCSPPIEPGDPHTRHARVGFYKHVFFDPSPEPWGELATEIGFSLRQKEQ